MRTFNADAFAMCKLVAAGKEFVFKPASVGDLLDYFPKIVERMINAETAGELFSVQKEVIRRYIPELTDEIMDGLSQFQFGTLFALVRDGIPTTHETQNFIAGREA